MNRHPRLEAYLDTVTSSLSDDAELRLDVRAEFAAHLDETAARFQSDGHSPDESAELTLKTFGQTTDFADELLAANRLRMRLRSRARLLLRALVIPAAVVAAVVSLYAAFAPLSLVSVPSSSLGSRGPSEWLSWHGFKHLSPQQHLIVYGDSKRTDTAAAQRAIWEAWPTNVVYLNNYLSHLCGGYGYESLGHTADERLAAFDKVLDTATALDPANARYHYLRADKLLEQGATIETVDLGKNGKGESRSDFRLVVKDRATLDRAMAELSAGLRQPAFRRYSTDMLCERLAILGPPVRLTDQIEQIGISACVLLPDISAARKLARASVGYARLLATEGKTEEARPFADAWQTLTTQITEDSFTLIDVLVAGAIAKLGETNAVAFYREIGDTAAAERTRVAAAAIGAPVAAFRARAKAGVNDDGVRAKAGVLAGLLLPALGEKVPDADLTPSRLVEYTILDQATCGVAGLILVVLMFGALGVALRWRFLRGGASAPLLLLPDAPQFARILGYGVLLPLGLYLAWTHLPLPHGRGEGLSVNWPAALILVVLLVAGIVTTTVTLAARAIRIRCKTLGIEVPPAGKSPYLIWGISLAIALICASFAAFGPTEMAGVTGWHDALLVGLGGLGAVWLTAALAACTIFLRGLFGSSRYGLYRGTVARSLIPYFALATVLLTLVSQPYLSRRESRLIASDPLIQPATSKTSAGFTRLEARLVERLRSEMLKAEGR